jgi:hypothetical protein
VKALLIFGTVESNDERLIRELKHNVVEIFHVIWIVFGWRIE